MTRSGSKITGRIYFRLIVSSLIVGQFPSYLFIFLSEFTKKDNAFVLEAVRKSRRTWIFVHLRINTTTTSRPTRRVAHVALYDFIQQH